MLCVIEAWSVPKAEALATQTSCALKSATQLEACVVSGTRWDSAATVSRLAIA